MASNRRCMSAINELSILSFYSTNALQHIKNETDFQKYKNNTDTISISSQVFKSYVPCDCHITLLTNLDGQLEQVQKSLLMLAAISFLINNSLYQSRHELYNRQKEKNNIESVLNIFDSTLNVSNLPTEQLNTLQAASLHAENFRDDLPSLAERLQYAGPHHPHISVWESLWNTWDIVIPRIQHRLEKTFHSLAGKHNAFKMLRTTLLYEQPILRPFYGKEIYATERN